MTTPALFDATVLDGDENGVWLRAGRCQACDGLHVPHEAACPRCGGPVVGERAPSTGTVVAVTTTKLPVLGAPPPVTVALVELHPDLVAQAVAVGPVLIDDVVRLIPRVVPSAAGDVLAYGVARATADA